LCVSVVHLPQRHREHRGCTEKKLKLRHYRTAKWLHEYLNGFRSERRVVCRQPYESGARLRLDPDCAHATEQRERVLADDFGRPLQVQRNCRVGKRPDRAKFIRDFQYNARRIDAVADQLAIVRLDEKLLVHTFAGQPSSNHNFAADVTLDLQITPTAAEGRANVRDKRRVREIAEVLLVRIDVRHQTIADVDLQVLAVRANHRDVEALVAIAARPVKRGLQHDLFFWITLRLVKTSGRFRNPKDVRDAVIANTIAGAKISVRVVVKRAPANPARVSLV